MKRAYRLLTLLGLLVVLISATTLLANATELKTGIGIVEASSGLRLRAKATTDSQVVNTAGCGDNVVIIRQVGDWYLVDYNLDIGYMSADYITAKERENVELGYGSVNPYLVNIRSGPSTSNSVAATASQGEGVYIIGFNCGWYKVQYNGTTGYIRSDLVTLTEVPYANSGSSNTFTGTPAGPSSSSSGSSSSSDTGSSDSSSSSSESYSEPQTSTSNASLGAQIAATAQSDVGYPYVFGGTSPSGFDCSGFVQYIYKLYGYSLYRTADVQLYNGYAVSDLQPGDLVFFANTYATSAAASHVGIYIGGNQFVHAANSRTGVTTSSLGETYYASRYVGARRIV